MAAAALIAICPRWVARPLLRGDTSGSADAIVVLGGAVTSHCEPEAASRALAARAVGLYRDGRAPLILFVGGRTRDDSCAAAQVMADLAVRAGVPPDRVRAETTPTTTREASLRSDADLLTLGASRVLLVTPELQMRRAEASFSRLGYGIERSSIAEDDLQLAPWTVIRSTLGGYVAWITDSVHAGVVGRRDRAHVFLPSSAPHRRPAPAVAAAVVPAKGPIVLLGTSYAASWTLDHINEVPIVNKGHGGDTTAQLLGRFDRDVLALSPRAVVLWGFDNDLLDARARDMDLAMGGVEDNILRMIALAEAHDIQPILATEVTMRQPAGMGEAVRWVLSSWLGRTSYQDRINKQVLDGNVWLRELARRRRLPLLDVQPLVSDRLQYRYEPFAKPDGAHITPAGYAVITDQARRVLGPYFAERTAVNHASVPLPSRPPSRR